jgi:hypothetical protein
MIGAPVPISVEKETSSSVNICLQYGRSETLSIRNVYSGILLKERHMEKD